MFIQSGRTTNLNSVTSGGRPLLAIWVDSVWEKSLNERVTTTGNKVQQILDERILVLICHTSYIVHHVTSIMANQKLSTAGLEMGITCKCRRPLHKTVVCGCWIGMSSRACVVQGSKDPWRSALFYQVAHNLIVEVLDGGPFNLLADVFLLFGLQGQFDEDLLQFLVDIIDAQLLKRVILKTDMC